jgi:hypothetical protein
MGEVGRAVNINCFIQTLNRSTLGGRPEEKEKL